jgi:hypothetical protein
MSKLTEKLFVQPPPKEVDPEKFILGGSYDNLITFRPYGDENVVRIDPGPVPYLTIIIYNVVFIAFFYGAYWLIKNHGIDQRPIIVYGVPVTVGLVTCVGFTALTWHRFSKEYQRGPWLIYHKKTERIELPREKLSFDLDEVIHLQFITTKRLNRDHPDSDRFSELNLITMRDGNRKRWPILKSMFWDKIFDKVLKPILEETKIPVVRIENNWMGWETTEKPYRI